MAKSVVAARKQLTLHRKFSLPVNSLADGSFKRYSGTDGLPEIEEEINDVEDDERLLRYGHSTGIIVPVKEVITQYTVASVSR